MMPANPGGPRHALVAWPAPPATVLPAFGVSMRLHRMYCVVPLLALLILVLSCSKREMAEPDAAAESSADAGAAPVMAEAAKTILKRGPRRLSPFTVPSFLPNLAAGWISIRYGFKGPIGALGLKIPIE